MKLPVEEFDGVKVIAVPVNYLDAGNAPELKTALEPHLAGAARIVIDLADVTFIDSSGCGALLSCLRRVASAGGDLKLCGASRNVRAILQMVRMHRVFDLHNDRSEAVAAFHSAVGA